MMLGVKHEASREAGREAGKVLKVTITAVVPEANLAGEMLALAATVVVNCAFVIPKVDHETNLEFEPWN